MLLLANMGLYSKWPYATRETGLPGKFFRVWNNSEVYVQYASSTNISENDFNSNYTNSTALKSPNKTH